MHDHTSARIITKIKLNVLDVILGLSQFSRFYHSDKYSVHVPLCKKENNFQMITRLKSSQIAIFMNILEFEN